MTAAGPLRRCALVSDEIAHADRTRTPRAHCRALATSAGRMGARRGEDSAGEKEMGE